MKFSTKRFIFALATLVSLASLYGAYRIGHKNGCYDTIEAENKLGVNDARKGIGLSAWAWCREE